MFQAETNRAGNSSLTALTATGRENLPKHLIDPQRFTGWNTGVFHADGKQTDPVGKEEKLQTGDLNHSSPVPLVLC